MEHSCGHYSEGTDSDDPDSDEPDSEVEALLYSKIHYAEDIVYGGVCPQPEEREVRTTCQDLVEKRKLATCSDDEEIVILDDVYSLSETSSENTSGNDHVITSSDDDDDIMVFGDSDPDIAINANEVPSAKAGTSNKNVDLWRVDPEDKYRHIQGFRYHSTSNFHCKSCGKIGHSAKSCPKPKEKVCYLCALPGHRGSYCPSRMCSRCFSVGHIDYECRQPYIEQCKVCNLMGHPSKLCPDFWRRYHLTTKVGPIVTPMPRNSPQSGPFCFNCAGQGHFGHRCPHRRQGYISTPFVVSYAIPRWDESINEVEHMQPWKRRKSEKILNRIKRTSTENDQMGVKKQKRKKCPNGPQNRGGNQKNHMQYLKQQRKEAAAMRRRLKKKEKRQAARAAKGATNTNQNESGRQRRKAPTVVRLQSAK